MDNDGLSNIFETWGLSTDPADRDTDGDRMPDGWEFLYWDGVSLGFNPTSQNDGDSDSDSDGLSDLNEHFWGIDPLEEDSDQDGVFDGQEVYDGANPNDSRDAGRPINDLFTRIRLRGGIESSTFADGNEPGGEVNVAAGPYQATSGEYLNQYDKGTAAVLGIFEVNQTYDYSLDISTSARTSYRADIQNYGFGAGLYVHNWDDLHENPGPFSVSSAFIEAASDINGNTTGTTSATGTFSIWSSYPNWPSACVSLAG